MKTRFDETKYWITTGGEAIRLCDMETSHLLNTVKMLLQKPTRTQAMLVIDIERNSRDAAVWVPNPQDPRILSIHNVTSLTAEELVDYVKSTPLYGSVGDAFGTYDVDFGKGWSEGMNTFDTFQDGWGSSAYNKGAEVGRNIKSSVTGVFDNMLGSLGLGEDGTGGLDPYGSALGDIEKNTGDTAKNTGKSTEELSYLRDIAEREAINRFTTAEIKVDLGGVTNNVAANTDLDGIISYLTDGVAEALVTASEGVY